MSLRSFATRARVTVALVLTLCATPAVTFAQEIGHKPGERVKFFAVYSSFVALQAMDAHSTLRALNKGASESNPLVGGMASQPAALLAMKAGSATATIFLAQRLRKEHPVGALFLMAGINSAYATLVAHNYRAVK
jgi:hypothetical protein